MKSKFLHLIATISLLTTLSSCILTKKSNLEMIYQKYDSSYSTNNFKIRKIDSLLKKDNFINALDVSMVDLIQENGGKYYNFKNQEEDFFSLIKSNNINTIRVRLFNDYNSPIRIKGAGKLDIERVLNIFLKAKQNNLKLILDFHFSDTWADPTNQICPFTWQSLSYEELLEEVYDYTKSIINFYKDNDIFIDYIQIGNEIDNGLIHPFGQIDYSSEQTINDGFNRIASIINSSAKAIREVSTKTKIIIHTANAIKNVYGEPYDGLYFFDKLKQRNVDFDIIGSSFYSFINETKIETISYSIDKIAEKFNKPFMLMEYSYGFTDLIHPYANNILSKDNQLEDYPLSIQSQTNQIIDIIEQVSNSKYGIGTCYWGGEWIPVKNCGWGDENTKSSWSNQALFTYEGLALTTLKLFKEIY